MVGVKLFSSPSSLSLCSSQFLLQRENRPRAKLAMNKQEDLLGARKSNKLNGSAATGLLVGVSPLKKPRELIIIISQAGGRSKAINLRGVVPASQACACCRLLFASGPKYGRARQRDRQHSPALDGRHWRSLIKIKRGPVESPVCVCVRVFEGGDRSIWHSRVELAASEKGQSRAEISIKTIKQTKVSLDLSHFHLASWCTQTSPRTSSQCFSFAETLLMAQLFH